jgi:hypothetical protein
MKQTLNIEVTYENESCVVHVTFSGQDTTLLGMIVRAERELQKVTEEILAKEGSEGKQAKEGES